LNFLARTEQIQKIIITIATIYKTKTLLNYNSICIVDLLDMDNSWRIKKTVEILQTIICYFNKREYLESDIKANYRIVLLMTNW